MPTAKDAHPAAADLDAFVAGKLPPARAAAVEAHVADCAECCAAMSRAGNDTYSDLLRAKATTTRVSPAGATAHDTFPELPAELRDHPRYSIRGKLGEGGMGVVYLATHRVMDRPVALKTIRPALLSTPAAVARFRREAQTAGKLQHPNIVAAFDAEEIAGVHFLVMEYVEGKTLDTLVERRGPLEPALACGIARQAAVGLAHAHARGMIHRDVKPANLIFAKDGKVKILDFGLARWSEVTASRPSLTADGVRLGTLAFAPPEQWDAAGTIDERADVYSLGATLFYLLTARPPIPDIDAPDPLRLLPATLSPELRGLITRMIAPERKHRPASAKEVIDALAPFCAKAAATTVVTPPTPGPTPARKAAAPPEAAAAKTPPPRRKVNRRRAALLLAGGVVLGGLTAGLVRWAMQQTPAPATPGPVGRTVTPPPPGRRPVVFLLPGYGMWYDDYAPSRAVLEREGYTVRVATPDGTPSRLHADSGKGVAPREVAADVSFDGVRELKPAAVVCVGAASDDIMRGPKAEVARMLLKNVPVILAVCAGQDVVAAAGRLSGRRISRKSQYIGDHRSAGATVTTENVVTDGMVVTATYPSDAAAGAAALVALLRSRRE